MAVVANKSSAITNMTATPKVQNNVGLEGGVVKRRQGFAVIANGDSVGSTYRICRVRSSEFCDKIRLDCPDIGTTTAADIGLYDTADNGGAVVDADFFASAVVLNAGALSNSDVTFEAAAAGGSIANAEKRIWEALGLSADSNKEYELALTLTGAADAAGTALVRYFYIN
jgi:hypothetical protein